jgi:hypothetical protein
LGRGPRPNTRPRSRRRPWRRWRGGRRRR